MKLILLALIATALSSAHEVKAQTYSVYKSASCGDYVAHSSEKWNIEMASQYARGYLSAYNVYAGKSQIIADISSSTIGLYIEKFCQENPLLGVHNAAAVLARELSGTLKSKSQ